MQQIGTKSSAIALACGVLGVLAAVWAYWLIIPGVLLGAVAIVLGWRSRRNAGSELGSATIALGIVAILLVPSVSPSRTRRSSGVGLRVGPNPRSELLTNVLAVLVGPGFNPRRRGTDAVLRE